MHNNSNVSFKFDLANRNIVHVMLNSNLHEQRNHLHPKPNPRPGSLFRFPRNPWHLTQIKTFAIPANSPSSHGVPGLH